MQKTLDIETIKSALEKIKINLKTGCNNESF
jgi:hypothetical protein